MERFKQVTKEINLDYDYGYDDLEYQMQEEASRLFKENYGLDIDYKDISLEYSLSYSQGDGVMFGYRGDSMLFNTKQILDSLLYTEDITKEQYKILLFAHEMGLYNMNVSVVGKRNCVDTYETGTNIISRDRAWQQEYLGLNRLIRMLKKYHGDISKYKDEDDNRGLYTAEYSYEILDDIFDTDRCEGIVEDMLKYISSDLEKFGYDYIEGEDLYWLIRNTVEEWLSINNINIGEEYYLYEDCVCETWLKKYKEHYNEDDYFIINNNQQENIYAPKKWLEELIIDTEKPKELIKEYTKEVQQTLYYKFK